MTQAIEDRWPSLRDDFAQAKPLADQPVSVVEIDQPLCDPHAGVTSEQVVSTATTPVSVVGEQPFEQGSVSTATHLADPYVVAKEAEQALADARQEHRQARDATLKARTVFSKALAVWNCAQPIMTQEQALRAYVEQSNRDRAARAAAAGAGVYHPGITRTARAMSGGNQRRGGGNAFRRGPDGQTAYSRADAITLEARRIQAAAAARAKPPSEK